MRVPELFRMEVRAASDCSLIGWLPVPLAVYQGGRDWWAFEQSGPYDAETVRTLCLPVMRYAHPDGRRWWAFRATPDDVSALQELVGFKSAV